MLCAQSVGGISNPKIAEDDLNSISVSYFIASTVITKSNALLVLYHQTVQCNSHSTALFNMFSLKFHKQAQQALPKELPD